MSSSSNHHSNKKKHILINTTTISLGCSSSLCRRPKLSAIFHPRPRHHNHRRRNHHHQHQFSGVTSSSTATTATFSSDSSNNTATTTDYLYYSSSSPSDTNDIKSLKAVQGFGRIGGASVAVEKDSDDPYLDFRQSMLQMILEREIYNKEDLKELLNCFLQLNSPYYHGIIVRAFTEIWNGVYSARNVSNYSPDVHGVWGSSRDF